MTMITTPRPMSRTGPAAHRAPGLTLRHCAGRNALVGMVGASAAEPADVPPTSLDQVLTQAEEDFGAAVAMADFEMAVGTAAENRDETPSPRLLLDILVPGLDDRTERTTPFNSTLLAHVSLRLAAAISPLETTILMQDPALAAVTQALCASCGEERCAHIKVIALVDFDEAAEPAQVYIVARPKLVHGDQLNTLQNAILLAPKTIWVLLNPLFHMSKGPCIELPLQYTPPSEAEFVRDTFECVYAFRSLYTEQESPCDPALAPLERGAVVKRLGEPTKVFKRSSRGYSMVCSSPQPLPPMSSPKFCT